MQRNAWYPGLVSTVRIVACWCSAFWLFTTTEHGMPLGIDVAAYMAFGVLSFAFFAWLMIPRIQMTYSDFKFIFNLIY